MARIIFADVTGHYDGRALETQALGGTESSVIQTARGLARRGHDVTVHSNCEAELVHEGVRWRPMSARPDQTCDVYIAVQQPELLGFVPRPKRRVIWVLWGANQLRHYKRFWRLWLHPPKPILMSEAQLRDYWPVLPGRGDISMIHLPLPEAVRGHAPLAGPPPRRAIFASNPQRNLRALVELWGERILPALPDAVLDVYGVNNLKPGEDAWELWAGTMLPADASPQLKASVRVHLPVPRAELIEAMRGARVMLYLGHKCEAFCLSLAEAQALGTPAVIAPVAALPERVIDGVTGFHHADPAAFADAAIRLLTDDELWRRQHLAALALQQGASVEDYVTRFEAAMLGRPLGDIASAA